MHEYQLETLLHRLVLSRIACLICKACFAHLAGEAISTSANFTVEKNSSRIEVADAFTLHRSAMPSTRPDATAAAASQTAASAPALTRKGSKSPRPSGEQTVTSNRSPAPAQDGAPLNTLRVTLHPVGAGTYPSNVVLTSGGDVRVLDVEFVATKSGQQVTLEFNSPARDKLVQEVRSLPNSCCQLTQSMLSTTLHGKSLCSSAQHLSGHILFFQPS